MLVCDTHTHTVKHSQYVCVCDFQQRKVYLERSVKEAEDNIREMLLSRRAH